MAMGESDIVKDSLIESDENLDRLDRELVGLEKSPEDKDSLAAVFRTTTGTFFALSIAGNCLMNSIPSMTGILMSQRIRSTGLSLSVFSASAPLAAWNT